LPRSRSCESSGVLLSAGTGSELVGARAARDCPYFVIREVSVAEVETALCVERGSGGKELITTSEGFLGRR
jgi:hypothetical protein